MTKNKKLFSFAILICLALFAVPIKVFSEESLEVVFNDPFSKNQDTAMQDLILTTVEDAEKRIYIAVYNFTDTTCRDALIDAVKRGVEVRLVIYSENADNRIIEDLKKNGIKIVKSQSEGLMHAKFIVVDYETTISGSANLTSGSFFYDNNFMILIHDSKVNKIFQEEFNEMFIEKKFGTPAQPIDFVFHGGSGSSLEEIREAISYGVIKMNIDTDTQWAFWDGVRGFYKKNEAYLQGQIGNPEGDDKPNKKYYDPRAWLRKGEDAFRARLKQAFADLNNIGTLG